MSRADVLVGRQPIFDRARKVHGYELMFRRDNLILAESDRPNIGALFTSHTLFSSPDLGVDDFVGDKLMFCDVEADLLTGDNPLLLPPERTVLEVPTEIFCGDDAVVGARLACRRLADQGYKLALDDFWWFEGVDEILPLFSFVKFDLERLSPDATAVVLQGCRPFDVQVLVESVDTESALNLSEELGVDLFQGYLFATPQTIAGRVMDPSQFTRARLAAKLLNTETSMTELEELVRADPALCVQLLHMAGTGVAGGMRRTVSTVRQALVLVGWKRLQAWVALLVLARGQNVSEESMTSVLVRARMCELLGLQIDSRRAEMAFTAGMLSGLDVLYGVPLVDVLRVLSVDDELRDAVLEHSGPLGELVADATDFQLGRQQRATRGGFDAHTLQSALLDALTWGIQMTTGLVTDALS